jgi:hypothetical protein
MLPFGSITSIIPLSVLAIAYALFICASALNRIKPATDDSQVKEIVLKDGLADSKTSVLSYSDIQDVLCSEEKDDICSSPGWVCCIVIDLPPATTYTGFTNFLFSRPPPSLFS